VKYPDHFSYLTTAHQFRTFEAEIKFHHHDLTAGANQMNRRNNAVASASAIAPLPLSLVVSATGEGKST
jgi:hypothetical protein